jgi:hypothetical protein
MSADLIVQDNGEIIFMLGWIIFFQAIFFFGLIFNVLGIRR